MSTCLNSNAQTSISQLSSNHHHQQDNPHYQGYNQNILLQKLQFQLAFLAAELEGIIREIFNEDVRGEKQ